MTTAFVYKKYYQFNDYYPSNLPAEYTSWRIFDHPTEYNKKKVDERNIVLDNGMVIEGFRERKIYNLLLIIMVIFLLFIACTK
jgi:hypothetical protein